MLSPNKVTVTVSNFNTATVRLELKKTQRAECVRTCVDKKLTRVVRINSYSLDSVVCFVKTCLLGGDLSGAECFQPFEQLGSDFKVRSV